jgi:hypothetical protein
MLRELLRFLRQILRLRRACKENGVRRQAGCDKKRRHAKAGDRCRQEPKSPRGQYAA